MSLTESKMVELGNEFTGFTLPDINGDDYNLDENFLHKGFLVAFICNHCPYVKHINHSFAKVFKECQQKSILVIAINSNDIEQYPTDSPENMKKESERLSYTFPYLFDETQEVAKTYGATCTPDFFLFDGNKKLFYRGQYDDARPGNQIEVTGKDLLSALDTMLSNKKMNTPQKPSIGCNIKWKTI